MTPDNYFRNFDFSKNDINKYLEKAKEDIAIAEKSDIPKVKTLFVYKALIKLGIATIAYKKGKRVRSKSGHHIKILSNLSDILQNKDIAIIGNIIRKKRNSDLYFANSTFTEKESAEYIGFIKDIYEKVKKLIK